MRRLAGLIAVLGVLSLLLVLTAQWLQRSLLAAGIEQWHWQELRWRDGQLHLQQIGAVYVHDQGRLGVRGGGVSLRPVWREGPRIGELSVDELQLIWQPAERLPEVDADQPWQLPSLADLADPLAWLPERLQVDRLLLQLPCPQGQCMLQGSVRLDSQAQPLELHGALQLASQEQRVSGQLDLTERNGRYLIQAALHLPEPLSLPGIGTLSGEAMLDLENETEQWRLNRGRITAKLENPEFAMPASLPRPETLMLDLKPDPASLADWQDRIDLALDIQAEGPLKGQLQGNLRLQSQDGWNASLDAARLRLAASRLELAGVELSNVELDWPLQASGDSDQLTLELGAEAPLTAGRLALAEDTLVLHSVRGQLGGARLLLPLAIPEELALTAPLRLSVDNLQQAVLQPQSWELQGELRYAGAGLDLDANLTAASGLDSRLQLDWPADQSWQLQATLNDIFLRAGNPLATTLVDWPDLLSFSSGRITGQIQASGLDSLQKLSGQVTLTGAEGIYDRAAFRGLTLPLSISLQGEQLRLATGGLRVDSLDPGLELGPLQARGSYATRLAQPARGVLELQSASLGVLGGRVSVEPGAIDLGQPRQSVVARVEGLELTRLFEVYPAEGLSGRGTLDGRFPVSLVDGKLLIEDGRLQARAPGGVLSYQAEQLQSMAAANASLEQLAAALDDFRYSVLASDVSYDEQGVLVLGLRLEGHNPAFQQGRQVNLNIRLEEDIPALLTSLQLSGQVSDIIRKRIEQRYIQRGSP